MDLEIDPTLCLLELHRVASLPFMKFQKDIHFFVSLRVFLHSFQHGITLLRCNWSSSKFPNHHKSVPLPFMLGLQKFDQRLLTVVSVFEIKNHRKLVYTD